MLAEFLSLAGRGSASAKLTFVVASDERGGKGIAGRQTYLELAVDCFSRLCR